MKAGLLKTKININEPVTITTEYGENITSYKKIYSTRANVKFKNNTRAEENKEILYNTIVEFKVRYYVPVSERCRIELDGKQYRILSLLPNKDNQEIIILTELVNE